MKPGELYLLAYNFIQFFGWGAILLKTVRGLNSNLTYPELYNSVELELKIFQTAAVLEIFHCIFRLVRSPVGTTTTQVFSRVTVVWLILHKVASSRLSVGLPMLLTAWSVTEVIRYSFYALNLINAVPWILIWMRYTFFILLYPLGAGGELLTMFAALPEIAERKHFTLEMPNKANFSFNFYWIVILFTLTYIPLFPQLYGYMFVQRKKVLGGNDSNKEKKAE
ncbi:Very-long-chain [Meloidogyne graminicola]|uniref:Very-long-chain (3R)-3-hydroxyacyl-CoA dehydratase n=1 Tax=Meloidogyne graminicola TaxID=189291 RepID=A0A8S9Z6R2_9BILA|nr:Very-long-chain [Meloidogyne graminicola]